MNKYTENKNDRNCIISPKLNTGLLFLVTTSLNHRKLNSSKIMVKEAKFF